MQGDIDSLFLKHMTWMENSNLSHSLMENYSFIKLFHITIGLALILLVGSLLALPFALEKAGEAVVLTIIA